MRHIIQINRLHIPHNPLIPLIKLINLPPKPIPILHQIPKPPHAQQPPRPLSLQLPHNLAPLSPLLPTLTDQLMLPKLHPTTTAPITLKPRTITFPTFLTNIFMNFIRVLTRTLKILRAVHGYIVKMTAFAVLG